MSSKLKTKTHVWSAISPITNELHIGHKQPTLEQAFWNGFEYCGEFRNYTLSMRECKPCVGFNNPNAFKFRIQWTDADDHLLEKYVETEEEANEIMEAITTSDCWNEMKEMLELLEFRTW